MHRPAFALPVQPVVPAPVLGPPLRSLFVMRPTTWFDSLRAVVKNRAANGVIARVECLPEALDLVARDPVDVLVLDRAIDPSGLPVLIWHQRSARRHSLILAFDDLPLSPSGGGYRVWSWADAVAVLRSGLDQRLFSGAPAPARPS